MGTTLLGTSGPLYTRHIKIIQANGNDSEQFFAFNIIRHFGKLRRFTRLHDITCNVVIVGRRNTYASMLVETLNSDFSQEVR